MSDDPVTYWTGRLAGVVGAGPAEIAARRAALEEFCAARGLTPVELLKRWEEFPELRVRRSRDPRLGPDLAVESFLIHNGVNVFGDIVCVPGRPEDLAEQGPQFVPPSAG